MKVKRGKRVPRIPRPIEENLVKGYDSNWDFVRNLEGKKILLESKGRFWDYAEYSKYIWIKKVLKEDTELVFLFLKPSAPMPQAKRRKDGTKRSHGEWASANGFRWFSTESIPKEWIDNETKD